MTSYDKPGVDDTSKVGTVGAVLEDVFFLWIFSPVMRIKSSDECLLYKRYTQKCKMKHQQTSIHLQGDFFGSFMTNIL